VVSNVVFAAVSVMVDVVAVGVVAVDVVVVGVVVVDVVVVGVVDVVVVVVTESPAVDEEIIDTGIPVIVFTTDGVVVDMEATSVC